MSTVNPSTVVPIVSTLFETISYDKNDGYEYLSIDDLADSEQSPRDVYSSDGFDETLVDFDAEQETTCRQTNIVEAEIRENAAVALAHVAVHDPETVVEGLPTLIELLEGDGLEIVRESSIDVLRALAEWRPSEYPPAAGLEVLGVIIDSNETSQIRGKAAFTLALAAEERADIVLDVVLPQRDAIVDLLDESEPFSRHAGATLLSHVAQRESGTISDATDSLETLLDDDHAFVRGSALWALRHVGGVEQRKAIQETAKNDPDPEIRELAEVLDNIMI
jgi:HEAT repeat protein